MSVNDILTHEDILFLIVMSVFYVMSSKCAGLCLRERNIGLFFVQTVASGVILASMIFQSLDIVLEIVKQVSP